MLALLLALQSVPVQSFPEVDTPVAPTRLGREVVFRTIGPGTFQLSSLSEGAAQSQIAVADPQIQFVAGAAAWRGRYVFASESLGIAATGGAPGDLEGLVPPGDLVELDFIHGFKAAGSRLFADVRTTAFAAELWTFDGGSDDPQRLPLAPTPLTLGPRQAFGERLFFGRVDSGGTRQPWISDGTAAGTVQLAEFGGIVNPGLSQIQPVVTDGERLWFIGRDGATGGELWVTDGTPEGTQVFSDLVPGPGSSSPTNPVLYGDRIAFRAQGDVWTAPVAGGPVEPLVGLPAGATPLHVRTLSGVSDRLYINAPSFFAESALWVLEGDGLAPVPVGVPQPFGAVGPEVVEVGTDGTVLFRASTLATGFELYAYDGGPQARLVVELVPGLQDGSLGNLRFAGDRVLFSASIGAPMSLYGISVADLNVSSMHPLGAGCPDAAELSGSGLPAPGATVEFQAQGGVAGTLGALLLGSDLLPAPAVGTCSVSLESGQLLGLWALDANGAASLPVTVPPVPALAGQVFRAQSFEAEPGGPVLGSFRASNVVEIVIGG